MGKLICEKRLLIIHIFCSDHHFIIWLLNEKRINQIMLLLFIEFVSSHLTEEEDIRKNGAISKVNK